jgi:hypothetical protein
MNGFTRTFVLGMALLGTLFIGAFLALIVILNLNDDWREAARAALLSEKERKQLADLAAREAEPARLPRPRTVDLDRLKQDLTEELGRGQVRALVEELEAKQAAMDDLQQRLQREDAEIRLAKADLVRLQRTLREREEKLIADRKEAAEEREAWAATKARQLQMVQVLGDVERAQAERMAKIYEAQKNDAWGSMRKLPLPEITRALSFMTTKNAAKIMAAAAKDIDYPGRSVEIHNAMLRMDTEGLTGNQIDNLAELYRYMKTEEVLQYLAGSSAEEIAAILLSMNNVKQEAAILTAMRQREDPRELDVQRIMGKARPNVAGAQ